VHRPGKSCTSLIKIGGGDLTITSGSNSALGTSPMSVIDGFSV